MARSKKNKKKDAVANSNKKVGKFADFKNTKTGKGNVRKSQGR